MRVKQLPSLTNPIPLACACAATYSWPPEDDLRPERRMPGHLDRQMPPLRVHDVKRVVVDEGPLLGQVPDHPAVRRAGHVPHRCHRARHHDQEHPRPDRVGREVVLGDLVLALAALAVDDRDPVRAGRGPDPAGEPPGHPHQMRVVQQVLAPVVQTPPPHPEPARCVAQRVVGIEHDAVHAVIAAAQKIAVPLTEPISHHGRFPSTAPKGPPVPGRVPERDWDPWSLRL